MIFIAKATMFDHNQYVLGVSNTLTESLKMIEDRQTDNQLEGRGTSERYRVDMYMSGVPIEYTQIVCTDYQPHELMMVFTSDKEYFKYQMNKELQAIDDFLNTATWKKTK